jgi:lipopolysaccharide heptosyltransferase II
MDKRRVNRILVIGLSNIGDAVLTTPVIKVLRKNFPDAHLALLTGPRAFGVFKSDRRIDEKIIYDKKIHWKNKWRLVSRLRRDKYDLVVDLRNTAFSLFLGAKYRTSLFAKPPKSLTHMKDRHLWKLSSLGLDVDKGMRPSVKFSGNEQDNVLRMFRKWQITEGQMLIAVAPGARNMTKRWGKGGYRQLIECLSSEYKAKIIVVGDEQDGLLAKDIISPVKPRPVNACGKTSIGELAFLLAKCRLVISNDSAPMHLAWAVNTPLVAIFGPTSHEKYAPKSPDTIVVRKELPCSACGHSLCPQETRRCLKLISAEEVFQACRKMLDGKK